MSELALQQTADAPVDPNKKQREASNPATSVWVGASAGSGKTKVLADRVVRLLLAGTKPQRILCLTFTKAAAAEMAIRVSKQLAKWATCSDDELRDDFNDLQGPQAPMPEQLSVARRLFAEVLNCPGGMRIHTIHAFAQEILGRFPIEAGLPPHFKVIEEAQAQALKHDSLDDVLQSAAAMPDSAEGRALNVFVRDEGEQKLTDLLNEAMKDANRIETALNEAGGLAAMVGRIRATLDLDPTDTEDSLRRAAGDNRRLPHQDIARAARIVAEKASQKFAGRAKKMLDWLALDTDGRASAFDHYVHAFLTKENEVFNDNFINTDLLADYGDVETVMKTEAARLKDVLEHIERARTAEQTEALLTLVSALNGRYAQRKAAEASLDFDDLIHRANDLLHREKFSPWVLFKLDGGLDHILVDEAQDTNPEQWAMIKALTEEFFAGQGSREDKDRTLFVVGDEKQSIFSFRKADPDAFEANRVYFEQRINEAQKPFALVPLTVSFRSAPAILRVVDAVFMADAVRQGVAREAVHHESFHREATGRVEIWPLIPAKEKTKVTEWEPSFGYESEDDPAQTLARRIAEQIKAWVSEGATVYDRKSKNERPATYGDIMILVRQRGTLVEKLVRELKARHIPVTGVDRMTLTEQLAVMDMMALLQFTLLPEDDLTLATVLRGPLLGLSEDDLMTLAIGRQGSLWQSLKTHPAFAAARDYLQDRLAETDLISPLAMLVGILNSPCPADTTSGRRAIVKRLGPDAHDPLDELLNAAQDFGARATPSLQAFLHELKASEAEIKREMDQGAKQVRITTVHASKGLEAPIVIMPDAHSVPDRNRLAKLLWDTEANVPFYIPRETSNPRLRPLREAARRKQLEEYRRLLYVAMTRAADRLYIGGWELQKNAKTEESWHHHVLNALKPLHEPFAVLKNAQMEPVVALADPVFPRPTQQDNAPQETDAPPLPDYLRRPPPTEPAPPRPLAPSRPDDPEPPGAAPQDARFARGRIIHRLLQSLPDVSESKRERIAGQFLANPQLGLPPAQQKEIAHEVMALLRRPEYAPLFGPDSRAEVPVVGLIDHRVVAGQIDRLCLYKDEVWIVDYKTNRPPPVTPAQIPRLYLNQMKAYRAVMQKIYPGKAIRCFLLWTQDARLMPLPDEI